MLIVSALREIGEGRITEEEKEIIKKHVETVSKKEFETDIKLIPVWIRKLFNYFFIGNEFLKKE